MTSHEELSNEELSAKLTELSEWENQMSHTEKQLEITRLKKVHPLYEKRREILKSIPKFWYIVLAEGDEFVEYVNLDDLKYIEFIDDIYVYYPIADTDVSEDNFKDFSITISFAESELIPKQTVTKHFKTIFGEEGEKITSEPVDIIWPKDIEDLNPRAIKQKNKGKQLSTEDKKNYRAGMRSFFAWFQWTGEKPGKEFRNGEDLTNLIVDDLYVNVLKYYTLALASEEDDYDEEEEDSSEGEELDLSEDEPNGKKRPLEEETGKSSKKSK